MPDLCRKIAPVLSAMKKWQKSWNVVNKNSRLARPRLLEISLIPPHMQYVGRHSWRPMSPIPHPQKFSRLFPSVFSSSGKYRKSPFFQKAPDTFNFLRHVMRAILFVRPKCSHRCVSPKEAPLKLCKASSTQPKTQRANRYENEMFKHIAI